MKAMEEGAPCEGATRVTFPNFSQSHSLIYLMGDAATYINFNETTLSYAPIYITPSPTEF